MLKLFTHTDLDGCGSAVLAKLLPGKDVAPISYCDNAQIDDELLKFLSRDDVLDYEIYIVDLSVSEHTASRIEELRAEGKVTIQLLDHHATALWLNKYEWALVSDKSGTDTGKGWDWASTWYGDALCGTSLFYDFYYSQQADYLLASDAYKELACVFTEAVRSWDTWDWKTNHNPYAADLATLMKELGPEKFVDTLARNLKGLKLFSDANTEFLVHLREKKHKYILKMKQRWTEIQIASDDDKCYKFGCLVAAEHVSDLLNTICIENPELDGAVAITEYGLSFRTTKPEMDVSKIAKTLGGGGHLAAAGASFTDKHVAALGAYAIREMRESVNIL